MQTAIFIIQKKLGMLVPQLISGIQKWQHFNIMLIIALVVMQLILMIFKALHTNLLTNTQKVI
ncbi:hypothetical protein AL052_25470 [Pseudomonas amygdali pv. eriobotryae]|nr:hypothetical protein AL052_25470 [Pseudomonas amygdali pv. eriobotryae]